MANEIGYRYLEILSMMCTSRFFFCSCSNRALICRLVDRNLSKRFLPFLRSVRVVGVSTAPVQLLSRLMLLCVPVLLKPFKFNEKPRGVSFVVDVADSAILGGDISLTSKPLLTIPLKLFAGNKLSESPDFCPEIHIHVFIIRWIASF